MQRYSLQSGPVDPGHTGGVFLPENILETSRAGSCRAIRNDSEERRANRYFDSAGKLRGPRFSLWPAASRGWGLFFPAGLTYACTIAVVSRAQRTEPRPHQLKLMATFSLPLPQDSCSNIRHIQRHR